MPNYFIESFKITKLWGYRDINLTFHRDVNVLIGPNASGKTTVLSLLHSILVLDLPSLLNFSFDRAEIKLRGFKGRSVHTVTVERDAADGFSELGLGKKKLPINIDAIFDRRFPERYSSFERGSYGKNTVIQAAARGNIDIIRAEEFYDELTSLVPIVWLPVSRRLPITEYEEERYTKTTSLESVDLRLEELLEGLFHYHSRLNTLLSKRYKEFELEVLSVMLYSKEHDHLDSILSSIPSSLPTKTQKDQLMGAFEDAELLNKQMRTRIEDHFAAAEEVVKRLGESQKVGLDLKDILVVPLIRRTQDMVEYARKLEEDREDIFVPIRRYEKTVNSFLNDKSAEVDESGHLKILSSSSSDLNPHHLSSGEKQILILLTQALLKVDEPIVYITDEPELSLHVTWQEKLLESLVTLGGQMQVIVATHSPDIVGDFRDKVIDLGRES
jgi:predicted ATP-dependent endonuclease of OLD family